jgi:hypothetical protein
MHEGSQAGCSSRHTSVKRFSVYHRDIFAGFHVSAFDCTTVMQRTGLNQESPITVDLSPHFFGCQFCRINNMLITCTTTEISRQRMPDFVFSRIWGLFQKGNERHQNAGSAISTLESMRFPECLLQRMEIILVGCQPFNGRDTVTIRLHSKNQTGTHGLPIEHYGARAANSMLTAYMRTRQAKFMSQEIAQQQARFYAALI